MNGAAASWVDVEGTQMENRNRTGRAGDLTEPHAEVVVQSSWCARNLRVAVEIGPKASHAEVSFSAVRQHVGSKHGRRSAEKKRQPC